MDDAGPLQYAVASDLTVCGVWGAMAGGTFAQFGSGGGMAVEGNVSTINMTYSMNEIFLVRANPPRVQGAPRAV